jgi:hypothetical protein
MSRFNAVLHRTGDRIGLPPAVRSLILVEIAADLEDLFQHYLRQGLSEDEAAARAEEMVDLSDDALAELVNIHSDARGWAERVVQRSQPFWERIAMALIVLFFVAIAAVEPEWDLMLQTSVFIWPVLAILGILLIFVAIQLFGGWNGASPRRLRDALATPLFLGAASAVTGFVGFGIGMYSTLKRMAAAPQHAGGLFAQAILNGTSTLIVALLVTLVAAVVWFFLAGRVARIENEASKIFPEVH